jgi:hypothetical protein
MISIPNAEPIRSSIKQDNEGQKGGKMSPLKKHA